MTNLEDSINQGLEREKSAKSKNQNPWAFTWNSLRLGAAYTMLGEKAKAKSWFENVLQSKSKDRWSVALIHQAQKFLKNGGNFAMFELMMLTGLFEKVRLLLFLVRFGLFLFLCQSLVE